MTRRAPAHHRNFGVRSTRPCSTASRPETTSRAAESQVRASIESLRNTEENILFNAASAYMDVIRDRQVAVLTEQNLEFLTEQARAARSRFEVGEGTRTDVAQADASVPPRWRSWPPPARRRWRALRPIARSSATSQAGSGGFAAGQAVAESLDAAIAMASAGTRPSSPHSTWSTRPSFR